MCQPDTIESLLAAVAAQAKSELAPLVSAIDQDGVFPAEYLRNLGALGGFDVSVPVQLGGHGFGLATQIAVINHVGNHCGSTAFLAWCQSSCAWYLQHAPNASVRERYLEPVSRGMLFAGTGMSNTVKHLAGIEKMHLTAQRDGDGYTVNGTLPWVSNVGEQHLVIVAASVEGEGYVMFAVHGSATGLSLHPCPAFSGLTGTRTLNLRFKDARIPNANVLAHPNQFRSYMQRIKAGFMLGQTGMGFGVIEGSLKTIRESNVNNAHVNTYLDDQEDCLAASLNELKVQVAAVAEQAEAGNAPILSALKLRAAVSELALQAANSAVLHAGAKGYLMRHAAQRRLREAVFVAIVTPALKHLRKEIHDIEEAGASLGDQTRRPSASTPLQTEAA